MLIPVGTAGTDLNGGRRWLMSENTDTYPNLAWRYRESTSSLHISLEWLDGSPLGSVWLRWRANCKPQMIPTGDLTRLKAWPALLASLDSVASVYNNLDDMKAVLAVCGITT